MIRKLAVLMMSCALVLGTASAAWADQEQGATKAAEAKAEKAEKMQIGAEKSAEKMQIGAEKSAEKMAEKAKKAKSPIYQLGDTIKPFTLEQAQTGEVKSLKDLKGEKGTAIIFWNQECPWVVGPNGVVNQVNEMYETYKDQGISVVLVDGGNNNKPESIKEHSKLMKPPLLINQDSTIAARFDARYTPEVFLLDKDMTLIYRGAFHVREGDAWRASTREAVQAVVNNQELPFKEVKGTGCSLKYAPGAKEKIAATAVEASTADL